MAAGDQRAAGAQASVLNASGYVTARRRATVSSKVTGKVIEVNVEEGMAVREGQVLARLDDSTMRARRSTSREAQLEAARRAVPRVGSASGRSQAHPRPARAARQGAAGHGRRHRSGAGRGEFAHRPHRLAARADHRGRAAGGAAADGPRRHGDPRAVQRRGAFRKDAQPGEMVSPVSAGGGFTRTGICTIVDMRSLEIEVDVNESYINRVTAEPAGHRRARRLSRLRDSGQGHRRRCRPPIGRRPRCWCASASTRSTRASCPTWA